MQSYVLSEVPAAAVLVLLSAAAGAGIVSSDLLSGPHDRVVLLCLSCYVLLALSGTECDLGALGTLGGAERELYGNCHAANILRDLIEHPVIGISRLVFVLNKRILLGIAPEGGCILNVLEGIEMVDPPPVDVLEVHLAEELVEELLRDLAFLCVDYCGGTLIDYIRDIGL